MHQNRNIKLVELKPSHVNDLYCLKLNQGLKAKTVIYIHRTLSQSLNYAVQNELIYRNVCALAKLPKIEEFKAKPLTKEEVKILMESAKKSKIFIPVLLAVSLGLRRGEAIGLRWQDIDFKKRTLTINQIITRTRNKTITSTPKTKSSIRELKISNKLLEVLIEQRKAQQKNIDFFEEAYQNNDLVFCYENGSKYSPNTLNHLFNKILKEAKLSHIRFHDLRHTFGTLLVQSNENMKTIQMMMGHSSIRTTMDIYGHASIEMQNSANSKMDSIIY